MHLSITIDTISTLEHVFLVCRHSGVLLQLLLYNDDNSDNDINIINWFVTSKRISSLARSNNVGHRPSFSKRPVEARALAAVGQRHTALLGSTLTDNGVILQVCANFDTRRLVVCI